MCKILDIFVEDNFQKLKDISKKITKNNDCEDLLQETVLILYESDCDKISKLIREETLIYYIVRIMVNQYHSKTSPFFYKYKRYYQKIDGNLDMNSWHEQWLIPHKKDTEIQDKETLEINIKKAEEILQQCNWFDAEVFKLYTMWGHSLNTLSKATGINRNTLYNSINKIKKHINGRKKD